MALAWARSIGEFGATITFAGNYPGRTQTFPLAIYSALQSDTDSAVALSVMLLVVSVAVLFLLRQTLAHGSAPMTDRFPRPQRLRATRPTSRSESTSARSAAAPSASSGPTAPASPPWFAPSPGSRRSRLPGPGRGPDLARRGHLAVPDAPAPQSGLVAQDPRLFPHLHVLRQRRFGLRRRGLRPPRGRPPRSDWLERLGLAEFAHRRPDELSGGQRQRVALARALATTPDLLLLDEPFAALDIGAAQEMRSVLREQLADFDGVVLLVTHDPLDALTLADHLIVLDQGRGHPEREPLADRRPSADRPRRPARRPQRDLR